MAISPPVLLAGPPPGDDIPDIGFAMISAFNTEKADKKMSSRAALRAASYSIICASTCRPRSAWPARSRASRDDGNRCLICSISLQRVIDVVAAEKIAALAVSVTEFHSATVSFNEKRNV